MVIVRRRPVVMFQGWRQLVLSVGDVSGFAVNCMQQAAYCTDISSLSETLIAHFMTVHAKVCTVASRLNISNSREAIFVGRSTSSICSQWPTFI